MTTDNSELSGQVALVTGGSRGIGLAISAALAEAGAKVAVVGRNEERAIAAAGSLSGGPHVGMGCDVADSDAAAEMVTAVQEKLGAVTILVNNAGITRDNLLFRIRDEDWDSVLDTNLKAAFTLCRLVARGMVKQRSGSIVNITSVVGLTGNAGQVNYAASKAGLIGLTKSVAKELASRGIRCNAVAPGFIETDMTADLSDVAREGLQKQIPLGTLGQPADIASLVRFLVGPSARYITGQTIAVDGGMVMQ